ncbi:MAG: GumC family protein [Nitritalea sp.]
MLKIKELWWEIKKYWYLFLLVPGILAAVVIFMTRNLEKIYDSHTIIYTGISTRKTADLTESLKIDYFTSNNLMDNIVELINSRRTSELVALKLLSQHLSMDAFDPKRMEQDTYEQLRTNIPESLRSQVAVPGDPVRTQLRIERLLRDEDPRVGPIRYVLENHKYYGISNISGRVRVLRKRSSDMIEISYYTDDPGIVYQTVHALADVYLSRYGDLRISETSGGIDFYIQERDRIFKKLQESEERLKEFVSANRIMNFYEQGKNLDNYINEIEKEVIRARQVSEGADASLRKLEEKLRVNELRASTIDSLSYYRTQVSNKRVMLNTLMTELGPDSYEIIELKKEIREISDKLSDKIASLYRQDFAVDGIPLNQILGEWLSTYLEKERELSALEISLSSKQEISDRIDRFAPLGAELKRLEREVQVNENEYLAILSGLNQARLQSQNLKISQTQEIIDPPFFPTQARSSKRKIMVAASFMFGHILLIGFFAGRLLLGVNLHEPQQAAKQTGLRVIGAFPSPAKELPTAIMARLFVNEWKKRLKQQPAGKGTPFIIGIHPVKEDKRLLPLLEAIIKQTQIHFPEVPVLHPESLGSGEYAYSVEAFHEAYSWADLLPEQLRFDWFEQACSIVIFPPYRTENANLDLIEKVDWHLFAAPAAYTWTRSDGIHKEWLEDSGTLKPELLLYQVDVNFIREIIGNQA